MAAHENILMPCKQPLDENLGVCTIVTISKVIAIRDLLFNFRRASQLPPLSNQCKRQRRGGFDSCGCRKPEWAVDPELYMTGQMIGPDSRARLRHVSVDLPL